MNKQDLISAISLKADLPKAASERALNALIDTITKAVAEGDHCVLVGFGTFKAADRAARTGRDPRTGAEIAIPATRVPRFMPGKDFKSACAG